MLLNISPTTFQQVKDALKKNGGVGSTEHQIVSLAERIFSLSLHLKNNKKDHSARRGLIKLVARRNKLLNYLSKQDYSSFDQLTKALGIRTKQGRPSVSDSTEARSGYLWHQKESSNLDQVDMSYGLWKWATGDSDKSAYQKLMIKTGESLENYLDSVSANGHIKIESSLGHIYYVDIHRQLFNDLVNRGTIKKAREQTVDYSLSVEDIAISSDGLESHSENQYSQQQIKNILSSENLAPITKVQSLITEDSQGCCVVIVDEGFNLSESFYQDSVELVYEIDKTSEASLLDINSINSSFRLGRGDHGDRVAKIIHSFAPNSKFCLISLNYSQKIDIIKSFSKIYSNITSWAKSRPVLINISFGTNIGLHDGTHDLEDGIHYFLDKIPYAFAFKSVGNEGDQKIHHSFEYSYNQKENDKLVFSLKPSILNIEEQIIVTHRNDPIGYKLTWQNECIYYYGVDKIYWDSKLCGILTGVKVRFKRRATSQTTKIFITFNDLDNLDLGSESEIEFELELIDKAKSSTRKDNRENFVVRAWIERTLSRSLNFSRYQKYGTITIPGSSDRILTITGFDGQQVPDYCSCGPTYNNYKREQPDLAAFDFSFHNQRMSQGTSFAAPRILGCAAIFLEIMSIRNKTLKSDELSSFLIDCTRTDSWDRVYGHGFFDYRIFHQKILNLSN